MTEFNDDMVKELEHQSWMLMRSLLKWMNEEGERPITVNIRGLTLALAWCVAQSHVQEELPDVDKSVELLAEELRLRIPEMQSYIGNR